MIAAGYPTHSFTWYSEIAAWGQQTASQAVAGWKTSDGHNKAMLACRAHVMGTGYGYSPTAAYGTRWIVDFGNYVDGNLAD